MTAYLFDNRAAQADQRFRGLQDLFNPITFRHLETIGVDGGWRCWEVGAGGPSVATWMADQVGAQGHVLATDINTSWLEHAARPNLHIRMHDVAGDPPPEIQGFDLIHARLVLVHLPRRDVALRNMVRALCPGGWLLIEDFDMDLMPPACLDEAAPHASLAQKLADGLEDLLAERGADRGYGRKLPRLLRQHGLTSVRADAYYPVAHPGALDLMQANIRQVRAGLIAQGHATADEVDQYLQDAENNLIDLTTPPLISAAGQLPTRTPEQD